MSALEEAKCSYAGADLLDCSRYGEVEDVTAILSSGVNANHQDAHGNTALHLSCANGHADVIRALIKGGANHLPNGAGNRPLQWAVQNKHDDCVKALVELYPTSAQMNVLDKNGFGKSALTDAFRTGDADMVKMVLNHKSAEEDMLLSQSSLGKGEKRKDSGEADGGAEEDAGSDNGDPHLGSKVSSGAGDSEKGQMDGDRMGPSITHQLGFGVRADGDGNSVGGGGGDSSCSNSEEISFLMRELPIRNPEECFGDDAREDTTGLNLWAAAVVLSRWMASPAIVVRLEGKTLLELGAGCGAGGISAAVHGRPASVLVTDLNVETMANLAHNVEINRHRYSKESQISAVMLDWGDESTWEDAAPPVDVIVAADIVYQATQTSPLLHAILSLLKPGGTFFHVSPVGERDGLEGFLNTLEAGGGGNKDGGFELVSVTDAPPEYTDNPLLSGSEEDFMLHFHEMPTTTYRLHELRKRP